MKNSLMILVGIVIGAAGVLAGTAIFRIIRSIRNEYEEALQFAELHEVDLGEYPDESSS